MIDWKRVIEWPWFAYHVLTWAGLVCSLYVGFSPFPLWKAIVWPLGAGLAWELYERDMERRHGVEEEHPLNRWIVDPLCDVGGGMLGWVLARLIAQWVS